MIRLARATILAVILCMTPAAGLDAQPVSPVDAYRTLATADSTYEAGDRSGAIAAYQRIVAYDPFHAHAWYRLGRAYESAERWGEAADALERAHTIGYRWRWWLAQRIAQHHLRRGEPERALDWLETSLAEGHEDRAGLGEDPAFDPLAGDPRFERLVGSVPDSLDRVSGWRRDLAYFVEEARRLHDHPDHPAFSDAFQALADSIHDRIPELDDAGVIFELQRLGVLLYDGHSGIYSKPSNRLGLEFPVLPVLFYLFEDGLHVVDGVGEGETLVGSRVSEIGGLGVEEVLRRLGPYVHRDNAMTPLWLSVRFYLPSARHLVAIGAALDPGRVTLTLVEPDGSERDVSLPTGDHSFRRKLRHPSTAPDPPPLWLREVDAPYRIVALPEADALYVPFNQVRDAEDGPSLAAFADSLRSALSRSGAAHLIVDVRHNNGGNGGLLRPLVRTMTWWEVDRPGRRIWVVTGRNTFSAAQIFVNQVEQWTDATFVGERSSSSPNFSGEETALVLPWSGVRGSISSRYHQNSDSLDDRAWIDPHLRVGLTAADYFAARDPVLEAIVEAIEAGRER